MHHFVCCDREWRDGPEWAKPLVADRVFWVILFLALAWFAAGIVYFSPLNDPPSFWGRVFLVLCLPLCATWLIPRIVMDKKWGWGRWLTHVLKANILGHTRWFGLKSDGSQVIVDKPYGAPTPKDVVECWLIIPWGGLFRRTMFRDDWIGHHALRSVKASHRSSWVRCEFTSGQKVDLSIRQFFALLHWQKTNAHLYDLDLTLETVLSQLRSVEERRIFWHSRFEELAKVVDEAVTAIALTRRFVRSRDGGDIRRWLIQQMSRVLSGTNCGLTDKYQELEKREVSADFQGLDRIYRKTHEPPPKKCGTPNS